MNRDDLNQIVDDRIRVPRRHIILGILFLTVAGMTGIAIALEEKNDLPISLQKLTIRPDILSNKPSRPVPLELKPPNQKISARLNRMVLQQAALRDKSGQLPLSDKERKLVDRQEIRVIFHTNADFRGNLDELKARGTRILKVRDNLVAVRSPIEKIEEIVTHVKGVEYARLPHRIFPAGVISEGVTLSGAANFHDSGNTGAGIRIAIVDAGFLGLSEAQSKGDIPYNIITQDYSGKGLQTEYKHGTACAEIVHDVAPDAELHLLKIADEIDLYSIIEYCMQNDIDIISASIGTFGSGPGDGTGPVCEAADEAREKGILIVAAAGNSANSSIEGMPYGTHWKGAFYDSDLDDIHEFIPGDSGSWYNAVSAVPYWDEEGNSRVDDVTILMRWDDWPRADTDYNLFLYDYFTGTLVGYSNTIQNGSQPPLESIVIDLPDSEYYAHMYYIVISKVSGESPGVDLELLVAGSTLLVPFWKYAQPVSTSSSSIMEPADAQSVLAVGAINYANWETGPQEDFSSQGPTNSWAGSVARIKPDICGPDGVSGYTYGASGFPGTSAAAPHVAGAAALILSMHPNLGPDELQTAIESTAIDMGTEGKDNLYGWGRLDLNMYEGIAVLGDINDDGKSDIHDLILSLQVASGMGSSQIRNDYNDSGADVSKDDNIGLDEAIYIMQKVAGLR